MRDLRRNTLKDQTSPYLRQHAGNPVHWQTWSDKALSRAQKENKPILLSIGYAACHWCHVMAHESFENTDTAAYMNAHFINIKVDREERPDLDTLYQSALAAMGRQGGWPLTMFLTPTGAPFWGGTYFPPEARYGMPAFIDILRSVENSYKNAQDDVQKNAAALTEALYKMSRLGGGGKINEDIIERVATAAVRIVDPVHGGTQGAPKFPQVSFFSFLWDHYLETGSSPLGDSVCTTLDHICLGGIYDHLGGGFARYSTDEIWLAPHFEKMLYDNAQLIEILSTVWLKTQNPTYADRVARTIDWLMSEMRISSPHDPELFAFAGALDADSEGREGQYYIWKSEQIIDLLGPHAPLFMETYDVRPSGNWEGYSILNRLANPATQTPIVEERLEKSRQILLQTRSKRPRPQRDDKILADWNAMTVTALVKAGMIFDREDWVRLGLVVYTFICHEMQEEDTLYHTWTEGSALHQGVLDDYAHLARAALTIYQATGKKSYLDHAVTLVKSAERRFWDSQNGGYFLSDVTARDLIARTKPVFDNAAPSGNGVMLEVLATLYQLTGDNDLRTHADRLIKATIPQDLNALVNMPSMIVGWSILEKGTTLTLARGGRAPKELQHTGKNPEIQTDPMIRAAWTAPLPYGTIMVLGHRDEDALLPHHPAYGKKSLHEKTTAYVCKHGACGLPLTRTDDLRKALAGG
ncbi:thioredoxin domain-containing protein [Varunaivibrio sulfuroxidans]|uniref:Spermatogenesis-associated protein 20-like TRX domain-containing protein n=1 Tax=Varunaivibrio sulfuroxidans TaxID=1773489 RepID=A0A4R3JFH0_9PROT|nr:thioredoxin domain-containing protein [Varunaivibrio sulfuroxidans]TCS64858.1 hypothetical protein EDD55_101189 [Varunaivibrio sulfuroxidans]WES29843.1 thioredoxin domain-containing protein [Varunaivibrio sulfuroxidans]